MNNFWPFADPRNVAVYTSKRITNGTDWIHYVTHDEDDGAWQFHPYSGPTPTEEVAIVALSRIYELEPRISEIADLPLGWCAWRDSLDGVWHRKQNK